MYEFFPFLRTDAGGVDMNRMWLTPMAPTLPALHHTLRLLQAYSSHPSFQVRGGVRGGRGRDRGEEEEEEW